MPMGARSVTLVRISIRDDVKIIIRHLMKNSDYYRSKDNAHDLIEEILAQREDDY